MTDELDDVEMEDNKSKDESKKEEVHVESDEHKVETDDVEVVESDNEGVTTPQMESASVVKYSVKTTPYLQRWDH